MCRPGVGAWSKGHRDPAVGQARLSGDTKRCDKSAPLSPSTQNYVVMLLVVGRHVVH